MGQIIQCLGGKTSGLDQISNKDATILYYLANEVKVNYAKLIWEDIIHKLNKKTKEKVVAYPSLQCSPLGTEAKPNGRTPFTDHMKAICNLDVHVESKAPKPSSQTEEVPQGKKPGAKSGLRRKQSSKHIFESKTEESNSKTGHSEKQTQSSLAKDKSLSHPSPPTPVVGEMHKEAQQAAGGPTSLGATSGEGAHPQLSSGTNPSVLVDQTKFAEDRWRIYPILKDTTSAFFTPDSPQNEPIIVLDESKVEEEVAKDKDTHASSHDVHEDTSIPHPPSLKSAQIQELMAQVQLLHSQKDELEQQKATTKAEPEISKLLASHNFASCLPTKLKELPLKFTELSREIKELEQHVKDMEIELSRDLKEIPTKLETFTSTISSLTSQVAELKNIQWELPTEFQASPTLVSSVQKKLKTLDSLPSLLNKVSETLTRFATMVENASGAKTKDVPSAGQATTSPAEGEKNTTMDAETNLQNELIDLLGIDVVEQYHNKKEDKIIDVFANFKVSDLHLAEWREVIQACPDRKEKGWKTIYGLIKTRMDYLDQTEKQLKIDFNKPLKEQDPLNELNKLANKKRKITSDLKDHSRSTKKHKSSSLA
ncbi:hypothetical protein Tco_0053402 [Tanacetum coccineum]